LLDDLLVREKAHTREGDAIAAARRRLPMVEVDPAILVTGEHGPVPLLEVFEGRRQLIAYFHMWHSGKPAPDQCEGCTFFNGQVAEVSYLHSRGVTYATFSEGPYEESARYREFMGYEAPWYSAQDSAGALLAGRWFGSFVFYLRDGNRVFETYWFSGRGAEAVAPVYALLDRTVYGRQEPGRIPRRAGHSSGLTPASSSAPTGAPPPSGRGWPPDAPTTWAPTGSASPPSPPVPDSRAGDPRRRDLHLVAGEVVTCPDGDDRKPLRAATGATSIAATLRYHAPGGLTVACERSLTADRLCRSRAGSPLPLGGAEGDCLALAWKSGVVVPGIVSLGP
jgi:predicted dithiol-disulfide oxidoreductase (DUF899 family)